MMAVLSPLWRDLARLVAEIERRLNVAREAAARAAVINEDDRQDVEEACDVRKEGSGPTA